MNTERPDQKTESSPPLKSRRAFAKAGMAAPVLMALASRPAFANFCTVSGFISATPGNVSAQRHNVQSCGGLSPGAWGTPFNGAGDWPVGLPFGWNAGGVERKVTPEGFGARTQPYGTTMLEAFGHNGFHSQFSMYDVLHMTGSGSNNSTINGWIDPGDPFQLGGHLVAALLNAAAGLYPAGGLTVDNVRDMYTQLSMNNTFEAAPGVTWGPEQVVAFIQQTFH